MKIAIFGGAGRTGIHLVRQALDAGHEVVALARTPAKMTIHHDKLMVIPGDATDRAAVARTIGPGTDAVISLLGPTVAGVENIIAVMKETGVRRLVVTLGAGVYRAGDQPPLMSKLISRLIKTISRDAYEQSYRVAGLVEQSGLDYTITRAPRLVDKPATGRLYVGPLDGNMKNTLSREDRAAFVLEAVEDNSCVGQTPVISDR
jgi:putative NADH-flavin reductase